MCGFAGFLTTDATALESPEAVVTRMAQGEWNSGGLKNLLLFVRKMCYFQDK